MAMNPREELHPNAAEYIRLHFPEAFIEKVNKRTGSGGRTGYEVTVNHDDVVTHLLFNSEGHVVHQSDDPVFPEDYYEGDFYGNEA